MTISITPNEVESVKRALSGLVPHAKSSHRTEAMARGLGFGSNAALLAGLRDGPVACSVENHVFGEFLAERGVSDVQFDALAEAVVQAKFSEQRAHIQAVLDREPDLSANGYRIFDPRLSFAEDNARFKESRSSMVDAHQVGQFMRAVAFLETKQKSRTVPRSMTSYSYKHQAERFHRDVDPDSDVYVANGLFIAAALHLGFTIRRQRNSPNVFINIAKEPKRRVRDNTAGMLRGPKRLAAWRNLLVAGLNAGLDQGVFGLASEDNFWDGEEATFAFTFDGLPALGYVRDAGWGELAVHVAVNPTPSSKDRIRAFNAGFHAGDAFASGWFEREKGQWLQTTDSGTGSIRAGLLDRISAARLEPAGYSDSGRYMM